MFGKLISKSIVDTVNQVLEQPLDESIKIPTSTGTKVLGSRYGNSAKAHLDQTKKEIDNLKGPTTKQLTGKDVKEELKGNQDKIDTNHNNKIDAQDFDILRGKKKKMKEGYDFASRLINNVKLAEEVEEELNEVLSKDASAGDWIHDFIHSDNPKFKGKTKAERKKMALGAYYGKQNEGYEGSKEDKEEDAKEAKKRGMSMAKWEKSAEDKKQDKKEMKEENYAMADGPITTDTLAGRVDGGKPNSFKSFKLRVNPADKEGDGSVREPACEEPEETAARTSIKARGGEVEVKKGEVVGTFHKEEVELNEDNLDSIAKKHGMEFKRTTYGAGMTHPKHGEVSINRYGEWHHYPAGSKSSKAHGDSTGNFSSLDKHLSTLKEETVPKKNTDIADKSYLKDMGKKPTIKSDLKNFKNFLTGKKETNEEVESIEERDEGKPGKMFAKIAAKAAKEYGSKEAGNRVAGAIRKKVLAKEEVEELEEASSRKDFQMVADLIKTHDDHDKRKMLAQHHAEIFHRQNPRFDRAKFMQAANVNEAKTLSPGQDDAPFDAPYTTTPSDIKDKSGAVHTPMSRAKDLARSAMKRVKQDLGQKK